jgi:hypothetical protein
MPFGCQKEEIHHECPPPVFTLNKADLMGYVQVSSEYQITQIISNQAVTTFKQRLKMMIQRALRYQKGSSIMNMNAGSMKVFMERS